MDTKKPILVVGGSGFIGQSLVSLLRHNNHQVRTLDLGPSRWDDTQILHFAGSFLHNEVLREAMIGVETVFHLAATRMPREANLDPLQDCTENVSGTLGLLETALETGVKRVVFTSSGGTIYGPTDTVPISETHQTNPISAYGISKLACEKYLRLYNGQGDEKTLSTIALRISNPYGQRQNISKAQGALTTFCHRAVEEKVIDIWGDGTVERDFVHVQDVAKALLKAGQSDVSGTEINIGSGEGTSMNTLLDNIEEALNRKVHREYHPSRSFDVPKNYLDVARAKKLLNWEPTISLQTGISELLAELIDQQASTHS